MHGGSAPQVRARAKMRLLELVDPALAVLARSMIQKEPPNRNRFGSQKSYEAAVTAYQNNKVPESVALKAATEVLDRVDLGLENQAVAGPKEYTIRFVKARPREPEEE